MNITRLRNSGILKVFVKAEIIVAREVRSSLDVCDPSVREASESHYLTESDPPAFSMAALAVSLALSTWTVSFFANSPLPRILTAS